MRFSSTRVLSLLALPAALLLGACDQGPTSPDGSGTFSIMLKDAPGDFRKAVVTIDEVYLQGDEGRVSLRQDQVTVDLLTLQNEVMELVDQVVVPGGTYSELRLVISGGYIEVEQEDGSTRVYASSADYASRNGVVASGSLQMPSFAQSGLKIKLPGGSTTVDGDQHILLLDFSVAESFGQAAGRSGMWVMRPVIRASDFGLTGGIAATLSLADTVTLPVLNGTQTTLAAFSALLTPASGGDAVKVQFTDGDSDGKFDVLFKYLVPGTYSVALEVPAGLSFTADKALPHTVVVQSGTTARESFTLTSASATQ